jgi:ectoine hydroxylase-related dioxygenase (phytanoyl-CoA dioxygenase family)
MSLSKSEIRFYKKKGYLVKNKLISLQEINNINKLIKKILSKEEKKKTKIKNLGGSYNNNFVYNSNSLKNREILRLNNPSYYHKLFYKLSRNKKLIKIVKILLGGSVRFHHCKLNFKLPSSKGGEVSWHQDWAFYPHTNDDLITVGVYLEDCYEENGPLQVLPGSHKKKIFKHHNNKKEFIGKICQKINLKSKKSLTGLAGTVTFHHVRMVHGSGLNLTNSKRPLILFGYNNTDAWPLTVDASVNPNENFKKYNDCIINGKIQLTPRFKKVPIIIPLPKKSVSIYQLQKNKK